MQVGDNKLVSFHNLEFPTKTRKRVVLLGKCQPIELSVLGFIYLVIHNRRRLFIKYGASDDLNGEIK